MATNFSEYTEAVRFLKEAAEAIDQAHACMKSAGLDGVCIEVSIKGRHSNLDVETLSKNVTAMARELEIADCLECDHPYSQHGDKHGCEYERGDVPMPCKDGGDVMAAAGPCGCRWGKRTNGTL